MTIYQLHKYSGEYDDFRDYIIGSYLRKERAEEEKIEAEAKERELIEHSERCENCPFLESSLAIDKLLSMYQDYCSETELEEDECGIRCDNYIRFWDESTFEIKEIEIEE